MYIDKKITGAKRSHTLSVLVENRFGVLSRVAGLFSGRGYNIESLTVNATEEPTVSRMTIVTHGDEEVLEQIDKQLNKLVDVISVTVLSAGTFLEREMVLFKVKVTTENRTEIEAILRNAGATVILDNASELGVEYVGDTERVEHLLKQITPYGLVCLARSGRVAIGRDPGPSETLRKGG